MLTEKIFTAAQSGAEGILWFLIFLSVASIAIIFERFFSLSKQEKVSERYQSRLADALQANALEELEEFAKDRESVEGRAIHYGLRHVRENGPKGLEELIQGYAMIEKPRLEKSLSFLATVGSNAPFIGLLGTVLGIMKAFNDLALSEGNANAVMTGIAEALVATAVGLFVAIPAVVAYNYFQRKVKKCLYGLEVIKELCVAYAHRKVS